MQLSKRQQQTKTLFIEKNVPEKNCYFHKYDTYCKNDEINQPKLS